MGTLAEFQDLQELAEDQNSEKNRTIEHLESELRIAKAEILDSQQRLKDLDAFTRRGRPLERLEERQEQVNFLNQQLQNLKVDIEQKEIIIDQLQRQLRLAESQKHTMKD